jgi:DNA-binding FadR family transcriptional regulator
LTQKPRFSQQISKQTLSEQVADTIMESIVAGEWQGGEALPTEPELAEQFGVSRAVIRDATRMLAAQGLVEAQHGRGVFVTDSGVEPFGDALLLALRRAGASVWDVEHFEQILYPEVFALAAQEATEEEVEAIHEAAEAYLQTMRTVLSEYGDQPTLPPSAQQQFMDSARTLFETIFSATHNQVLQLLGSPLLHLRNLRNWQDDETTVEDLLGNEAAYFTLAIDAIASRNPQTARETMSRLMELPIEAEAAMRKTPVGEIPEIPVAIPLRKQSF